MSSPIVHFQIAAGDPEQAQSFFSAVFGWTFTPGQRSVVANIDTGAREVEPNDIYVQGSLIKVPEGAPPYLGVFIRVADLDGTLVKAEQHGARVLVPRKDPPGAPSIAVIAAPTGHTLGIVQL
jgi:uncharacterized protein